MKNIQVTIDIGPIGPLAVKEYVNRPNRPLAVKGDVNRPNRPAGSIKDLYTARQSLLQKKK